MPAVASLVRPEGVLLLSLRHGPIPEGRRMFEVTPEETIALAARERAAMPRQRRHSFDQANGPDVTWSRLGFRRSDYFQGSATLGQNGVLRLV